MKKVINFHKAYPVTVAVSAVLILAGVVGLAVFGVNLGVDFRAGLNKHVQFAYPAMSVAYAGKGNAELNIREAGKVDLVFTGVEIENKSYEFMFTQYPTIGELANAIRAVPDMGVNLLVKDSVPSSAVLPSFEGSSLVTPEPRSIYRTALSKEEIFTTLAEVRAVVEPIGKASVQVVGSPMDQKYMIRVTSPANDDAFTREVDTKVMEALRAKFGADKVLSVKTDKVAERFSKSLADNSIWVTFVTLALIMLFATFRFKLQYAIGAVLAIGHDALIMVGFIVWTGMEFNTSTIAAILTILGYSINDTIVIFDRIRENLKLYPDRKFSEILNISLTEMLGRTFITATTTLLCVLSLYFLTADTMKDFALALLVGMVSGTYSTIFIASAFIEFWERIVEKRAEKAKHIQPAHKALPAKK